MNGIEFCKMALRQLASEPAETWATRFVALRMEFFQRYNQGLITSTTHGIDFFHNVIEVAEGRMAWEEKGEYGANFRKLIASLTSVP